MGELKTVRKFDGSSQPYSEEKLRHSLEAAGASAALARDIVANGYPLLCEHARSGMITSLAIKEEVAALLQARDPNVSRAYQEYRKPRGERE